MDCKIPSAQIRFICWMKSTQSFDTLARIFFTVLVVYASDRDESLMLGVTHISVYLQDDYSKAEEEKRPELARSILDNFFSNVSKT